MLRISFIYILRENYFTFNSAEYDDDSPYIWPASVWAE